MSAIARTGMARSALASEQQRAGRDPGLAMHRGDVQGDIVDEAPGPCLARLERADDRMIGAFGVPSRVPVRRVVAAADVPAFQADPQMEPLPAGAQAVLAAVDGL